MAQSLVIPSISNRNTLTRRPPRNIPKEPTSINPPAKECKPVVHFLCTTTWQSQIEIWVVKYRGIVIVKNCAFTYKVARSIEVQVVLFREEFKGKCSYSRNYERLSTSGKIHQHEDRVFELNIKQCQLKTLTRRQTE